MFKGVKFIVFDSSGQTIEQLLIGFDAKTITNSAKNSWCSVLLIYFFYAKRFAGKSLNKS